MEESTELEVLEPSAIAALNKSEIESQIEVAKRYPRSPQHFKQRAIEMACIDEETAASCIYRRPVGREGGVMKFAEGMSIRMAEIVGAAYGNLRVYATLISQTERQVIARGMAIDLEANFASSSEVVESTVDRNGKPYSERQRAVVAKAALAKARRDATFQVVPRALAKPVEQSVRKLLLGEAKSIETRRQQVEAWIKTLGIDQARVWSALGVNGLADIGLRELETLTGLRTAIKDGDVTIDEAFPPLEISMPKPVQKEPKPEPGALTAPEVSEQHAQPAPQAPEQPPAQPERKSKPQKAKPKEEPAPAEAPLLQEPEPERTLDERLQDESVPIADRVMDWIRNAPIADIMEHVNYFSLNWSQIPKESQLALLKAFKKRRDGGV